MTTPAQKQPERSGPARLMQRTINILRPMTILWESRMDEGSDVQSHIDNMRQQVNLLRQITGDTISVDELFALILLRSIPPTDEGRALLTNIHVQASAGSLDDLKPLSFDFVAQAMLDDNKLRMLMNGGRNRQSSVAPAYSPPELHCLYCGGSDHFAADCPDRLMHEARRMGSRKSRSKKFCDFYKSIGHNTSECRARDQHAVGKGRLRPQTDAVRDQAPSMMIRSYAL